MSVNKNVRIFFLFLVNEKTCKFKKLIYRFQEVLENQD